MKGGISSACGYELCLCNRGPLPSAVALPCPWAVLHWMGKRRIASQKHTTAASSCALPRPSAASPDPLSPRWRRTGSGWSDGRCCGCCSALVHPSSRWSCSERCGIRPGVPSPPCFPPPLSHQIPPRWTTGLTSCTRGDGRPHRYRKRASFASVPPPRWWLCRCLIRA